MWCVGLCLAEGKHRFHVFDIENDAMEYAAEMERCPKVRKVFLWEM